VIPENEAGLKAIVAAAGSTNGSLYLSTSCRMPRPMSGRFYIEGDATSDSDKRLTQAARFTMRLAVPSNSLSTVNSTIGTIWIEYVIKLTHPVIQDKFVGSCSVHTYNVPLGQPWASAVGATFAIPESIAAPFNNSGITVTSTSYDGSISGVGNALTSSLFQVPPGTWQVSLQVGIPLIPPTGSGTDGNQYLFGIVQTEQADGMGVGYMNNGFFAGSTTHAVTYGGGVASNTTTTNSAFNHVSVGGIFSVDPNHFQRGQYVSLCWNMDLATNGTPDAIRWANPVVGSTSDTSNLNFCKYITIVFVRVWDATVGDLPTPLTRGSEVTTKINVMERKLRLLMDHFESKEEKKERKEEKEPPASKRSSLKKTGPAVPVDTYVRVRSPMPTGTSGVALAARSVSSRLIVNPDESGDDVDRS